jgi:sugar phosphate permease
LLFTLGFQAICFALIPFVPGIWSLGALAVLFGIGDSLFDPVVNDVVTSMVADKNRNGVVGGLRVLKEAGKTAAPAGLGVILSFFDYELMFISIAAVVILYGVGIFFLMKHHW